ncbi:long-chain fatty acid transporter fat1 [Hypoxylon texense]
MSHHSLRPDMSLSIEPAVAKRPDVYDVALRMLGREWAWPAEGGRPFRRQLERDECKVGEFTGGFFYAYHVAVMRIMMESERRQVHAATPYVFQLRLWTPVLFIAPSRPNLPEKPEENSAYALLHSMASNLLKWFEDLNLCDRRTGYLTVEEMVQVIEKIQVHQWPNQPVDKYLCIVAELDRAYSADTMGLVHRIIKELDRIFVEGAKGDVFYFFNKPWGVARVLRSRHNMLTRM